MGFFDFLSAPKQDSPKLYTEQGAVKKKLIPPGEDGADSQTQYETEEALRHSQAENKAARSGEASTLEGASNANKSAGMAQEGLIKDYDRARGDALTVLQNVYGGMKGSGPFDSEGRKRGYGDIVAVQKAVTSKAHPLALAEDFDRLAGNNEFRPDERKAFAGVASMFRRSSQSRDAAAVAGEAPKVVPPQEAIQQAQAKAETLRRQEEEARNRLGTMGVTNPLRAGTQNAILEIAKEREALEGKLKEFATKQEAPQTFSSAPPLDADIKRNLAGGGRTEESFRLAVVGALKQAEKGAGFEIEGLDAQVPFSNAFQTLLPVLDPSGKITRELVDLAVKQKGPQKDPKSEGSAPSPESDATLAELKMKQQERRDLILGLGKDPAAQNWLSAIVTILLSAAIGSEKALRVMGYASRTNTLKYQLDILNQEINEDISLLREQREGEREMKREAARRLQRQEDDAAVWKRQLGMKMLDHKLIIERNQKRNNPETDYMKKLSSAFQRATAMAAKFSSTMNDPFADEAVKESARKAFEQYMIKASELDAQLNEMSNGVLEEEAVEE